MPENTVNKTDFITKLRAYGEDDMEEKHIRRKIDARKKSKGNPFKRGKQRELAKANKVLKELIEEKNATVGRAALHANV